MTSLYNQPSDSYQQQPSTGRRGISLLRGALFGGLTLASGLGVGAALMYLLDPQAGEQRRSRIYRTAGSLASNAASTASDLTSRAADYASDYLQRGREALPSSLSGITNMISENEDEGFSTTTFVLTALGCCAAGAALMFLLDPSQGRSRRKVIADKTTSGVRQSSEFIGKKARHYSNIAKGLYHETRNRFADEEYSEPESQSGGQSNVNPNM